MSEKNEDTTGYVLASEYARLNNLAELEVFKELTNGTLDGRMINYSWYVKEGALTREAEERANREKAQNEYKKSIKPVQVIGISIPFGDVLMLSFQGLIAALIIGVPIGILIGVGLGLL